MILQGRRARHLDQCCFLNPSNAFSGSYSIVLPTESSHCRDLGAGLLLTLLSLFYIPAAINPDRYRANAWLAVIARCAGGLFFASCMLRFGHHAGCVLFSLVDSRSLPPKGLF